MDEIVVNVICIISGIVVIPIILPVVIPAWLFKIVINWISGRIGKMFDKIDQYYWDHYDDAEP